MSNTITTESYANIGPGITVPTQRKRSMLDEYRAKQTACGHAKRDPRGMCYECGHLAAGARTGRKSA